MASRTIDIKAAINRAALFGSIGTENESIILRNYKLGVYAVIDVNIWRKNPEHFSDRGFIPCIILPSRELDILASSAGYRAYAKLLTTPPDHYVEAYNSPVREIRSWINAILTQNI